MKQTLLLISAIFFISGCGEKEPTPPPLIIPPVKQKCLFPKLPIYVIPPKKKMTTPVHLEGDKYVVIGSELKDCLIVNAKLRKLCEKHNYVNTKVNEEYQK